MEAWETYERNGHTVELHHDDSGMAENPRTFDSKFGLFLGRAHRRYEIGDETLPERMVLECRPCRGLGHTDTPDDMTYLTYGDAEKYPECAGCEGAGEREVETWGDFVEWAKREHDAIAVFKVGMIDHSGVSYYLGGGAHWCDPGGWDSGTCGYFLVSEADMAETSTPGDLAKAEEYARGEIELYSMWASGDVHGYIIRDLAGTVVDSCWGFYGDKDVREQATYAADYLPGLAEQRLAWAMTALTNMEVNA